MSTTSMRGKELDSLPGLEHLGRSPLERARHSLALGAVPFRILVFIDLALCSPLSHSWRTFRHTLLRGRTLARVNSVRVELTRCCFLVIYKRIPRRTWGCFLSASVLCVLQLGAFVDKFTPQLPYCKANKKDGNPRSRKYENVKVSSNAND